MSIDEKELSELSYWKERKKEENKLYNDHYKQFYTSHFRLDDSFYLNKRVLDIGCGPRGSLEWAKMAKERVGLDPLANEYLKLGADQHQMRYVNSGSEEIPFDDDYFDIVCSFNSIDHVEDLKRTCEEITRVLKSKGTFLLLTDIHEKPTIAEPQVINWSFLKEYFPKLIPQEERHFEKLKGGMYQSILDGQLFDHKNEQKRYGIISARLVKS